MKKLATRNRRKALTLYDPERGLKSIAVAEAGEKHWARAKDATQLLTAIETKIAGQADYVVWRDGVVTPSRKAGSSGVKGRSRITALKPDLPAADPGDVTVHRWRKRLCRKNGAGTEIDEEKFAEALNDARLRCVRICEQQNMGTIRGTEGTGEFERYTPAEYIEAAREAMGSIDLDPASSKVAQKTVGATKYFTVKDDGMTKEWHGNVWLNPPYHRDLQPAFIDKMVAEVAAGHVKQAIMLVNNSTDTDWFRRAVEAATIFCFTIGRVGFLTATGEVLAPTQGQTFFYFGSHQARFAKIFSRFGYGVTLNFKSASDD